MKNPFHNILITTLFVTIILSSHLLANHVFEFRKFTLVAHEGTKGLTKEQIATALDQGVLGTDQVIKIKLKNTEVSYSDIKIVQPIEYNTNSSQTKSKPIKVGTEIEGTVTNFNNAISVSFKYYHKDKIRDFVFNTNENDSIIVPEYVTNSIQSQYTTALQGSHWVIETLSNTQISSSTQLTPNKKTVSNQQSYLAYRVLKQKK